MTLETDIENGVRIAFASCMDAERVPNQPVWDAIKSENPDILMLLGDQIYMDWGDLGESNWKKAFYKDRKTVLRDFAEDMHRRYQQQWSVSSFRALITYFKKTTRKERVLITWDDHDFAWNNGMGGVFPETDVEGVKHAVPLEVKAVSRRLFVQFVNFLHTADITSEYEALSPKIFDNLSLELVGVESFTRPDIKGRSLDIAMLDTRWYHQERALKDSLKSSRILGPENGGQWDRLKGLFASPNKGLLLIAAGTPFKYKYLLSDQAWKSKDSVNPKDPRHFAEYAELMDIAAKSERPVLLMSGDVHRNVWGGLVKHDAKSPSKIIQVISSGAAIGNIGLKKFPSRFGLVDVYQDSQAVPLRDKVEISFWVADKLGSGNFIPDNVAGQKKTLEFLDQEGAATATDWQKDVPDGEDTSAEGYLSIDDIAPLPLIVFRTRDLKTPIPKTVEPAEMESLEAIFEQNVPPTVGNPPHNFLATPCRVQAVSASKSVSKKDELTLEAWPAVNNPQVIETLIKEAFDRAAMSSKSVVLYVHGTGNSLPAVIDHAYGLRERFNCEPIGFGWSGGVAGNGRSAYRGAFNAYENAKASHAGFEKTLKIFNAVALQYKVKNVPAILLLRSAGCAMFAESLATSPGDKETWDSRRRALFGNLHRIVLSSPFTPSVKFAAALAKKDNGAALATSPLPTIFVTINQLDSTLRVGKWLLAKDGPDGDHILGNDVEILDKKSFDGVTFLNFKGALTLHDYLFPNITKQQDQVNEGLLSGKSHDEITSPLKRVDSKSGAIVYEVN
jgi:hypothetical protein